MHEGSTLTAPNRLERIKLGALAIAWPGCTWLTLEHGWRLLPPVWCAHLTLSSYNALCLLLVGGVGTACGWFALREPGRHLGLRSSARTVWIIAILLAPAIYVLGALSAQAVAWDALLLEVQTRGVHRVQDSSGALGQQLRQGSLGLLLVWTVVLTPITEELIYRGALWGAAQAMVDSWRRPHSPAQPGLPRELLADALLVRGVRQLGRVLINGGGATLLSTAVFAAMHAGVPGAMGQMRVTNAAVLGLACGGLRQRSGSLVAPMLAHALCNLLTVAANRRWIISATFPKYYLVPTLPMLLALAGLGVAIAYTHWQRRTGQRKAS